MSLNKCTSTGSLDACVMERTLRANPAKEPRASVCSTLCKAARNVAGSGLACVSAWTEEAKATISP